MYLILIPLFFELIEEELKFVWGCLHTNCINASPNLQQLNCFKTYQYTDHWVINFFSYI